MHKISNNKLLIPLLLMTAVFAASVVFLINDNQKQEVIPVSKVLGIQQPINRKVLVIDYDPVDGSGKKLTVRKGAFDPHTTTNQIVDWFKVTTQNLNSQMNFSVVQFNEEPYFPIKADGFTYTEATYAACRADSKKCHFPDAVSWTKIFSDFNICNRFNNKEFDEVWVWGGGYFGYFENNLAGQNAFTIQDTAPLANTGCINLMPVVGLNWEVGLPNSIHTFGHRAEGANMYAQGINQSTWSKSQNDISNAFNRYTTLDFQSSYNFSGCGNIHYPPNSSTAYKYDSSSSVQIMCDDFKNYPNLPTPVTTLRTLSNCSEWSCTDIGYYRWWFQHLPNNSGVDSRGKFNNWWLYFANPDYVIHQPPVSTATPVLTHTNTPTPKPTLTPTNAVTIVPTVTTAPLISDSPLATELPGTPIPTGSGQKLQNTTNANVPILLEFTIVAFILTFAILVLYLYRTGAFLKLKEILYRRNAGEPPVS